eukprot:Gb_36584 [translate_table: standard]
MINGGPANIKVELIFIDSGLATAAHTSLGGSYRSADIILGRYSTIKLLSQDSGFTVGECVVNTEGIGVEGVKILVDQGLVDIHGLVICKEACSSLVSISHTLVDVKASKGIRSINLSSKSNDFTFKKVLPGAYHLEIKHGPSSDMPNWDDDWCWEQKIVNVDVGITDHTGITFVQNGVYAGHFLNSCIYFGIHALEFSILNPKLIYLTGQKYLLSREIHIDLSQCPEANELSESMVVYIWQEDGAFVDMNNHVRLVPAANRSSEIVVYEYSCWANIGDELVFVPRDLRNEYKLIDSGVCALGYHINVANHPNAKLLVRATALLLGLNGPNGVFDGGPLYGDTAYTVEASKFGYNLKALEQYSFMSEAQSMQFQAGNTMTFSHLDPEGKLVLGFRKLSNFAFAQEGQLSTIGNGILSNGDFHFGSFGGSLCQFFLQARSRTRSFIQDRNLLSSQRHILLNLEEKFVSCATSVVGSRVQQFQSMWVQEGRTFKSLSALCNLKPLTYGKLSDNSSVKEFSIIATHSTGFHFICACVPALGDKCSLR